MLVMLPILLNQALVVTIGHHAHIKMNNLDMPITLVLVHLTFMHLVQIIAGQASPSAV